MSQDQDTHDDGTTTFYVTPAEFIKMLQATAGVNEELHQAILNSVVLPR